MNPTNGIVRALAVRPGDHEKMVEHFKARATKGKGLDGDERAKGKRGITFLDADRWFDVIAELDTVLPWHTRRANVLVQGIDLSQTIGMRLRVGEVIVHIWGETKPCDEMEELCKGLKAFLKPHMRGGVHGEVLSGGLIRVNDPVELLLGA